MPNPIRQWHEAGLPKEILDVIKLNKYEVSVLFHAVRWSS